MNFPDRDETIIEQIDSWWSYNRTYTIEIPIRDFIQGIKNIFKWGKVVWEDRDWDYKFTLDVLKLKIKNTADYIEKTQRHMEWKRDVKYMRICVSLIDRIWPDMFSDFGGYESEYSDYHKSEFNWIPIGDKDKIDELSKKAEIRVVSENRERKIDSILDDIDYVPFDLDDVDDVEVYNPRGYRGDYQMDIKEISETYDDFFANNKLTHKKAIIYLRTNGGYNNPNSKMTQAMVISRLKNEKAKRLLFKILAEKLENWWD
jgi:hypothetical protein